MNERATEQQDASAVGPDPARWRALAVCLVAGSMTLLDVSIVNVALPSIRTALGADDSDIQWIVAGYALAFGVMLVPSGRLGDARSRRPVFAVGIASFTLASALAGAAPGPSWLSAARVLQGLAGGLITPQVSGFIQTMFHGKERGKAFGIFGSTIGLATAVGPVLGGFLVSLGGADLGWRLVFYVNVPIGIVALLLVPRLLPATRPSGPKQSLDPVGVLLFAGATFLVLLPLVEGSQGERLSSRPWWLLAVAAVVYAVFVAWERGWLARGKATLLDLSLLTVRSYVLGLCLGTFYFAGFTSIFITITLYLQIGLGYTALQAGLTQMSFAIGSAASAWLGGRIVDRFGRGLVVAGLVLVITALISVDLLVPHLQSDVGIKLAPSLLLAGIGGGLVISPNITLTLERVDPRQAGSGGSMLQMVQRVGSAIGVAVVLAQFFQEVADTGGDFATAFSMSLRVTVAFIVVALLLGVADLVTGRKPRAENDPAAGATEPVPT